MVIKSFDVVICRCGNAAIGNENYCFCCYAEIALHTHIDIYIPMGITEKEIIRLQQKWAEM